MTATMSFDAYTWTEVGDRWVCDDTSLGEAVVDLPENSQYWICKRDGVVLCRGASAHDAASIASSLLGEEAEVELAFEKHLGRREQYGRYSQIESVLRAEERFDDHQLAMAVEDERSAFRAGYLAAKRKLDRQNNGGDE